MSTLAEATRQAATIREYWRQRGYTVFTQVVRETVPSGVETTVVSGYTVRSDLINGMPKAFFDRSPSKHAQAA